uniref:ODF3A protein n=1 Tax=Electrophorus electricus TaxID=8005 RepID=A0AAY5F2L4_ELEEL
MSASDVWVGSWRPHKPRGPIAALYSSPGPKYALPGATGRYCPEKAGKTAYYSAPAYSLWLLGPAAYMLPSLVGPNTVNKRSAPNFSLTGRTKKGSFYEDLQKTPGPGSYRVVDPSVYRSKPPQYSLTSRTSMPGDKTKKPGPGAHCPEQVRQTGRQTQRHISYHVSLTDPLKTDELVFLDNK